MPPLLSGWGWDGGGGAHGEPGRKPQLRCGDNVHSTGQLDGVAIGKLQKVSCHGQHLQVVLQVDSNTQQGAVG